MEWIIALIVLMIMPLTLSVFGKAKDHPARERAPMTPGDTSAFVV
jgi:hypothetical protein